MEQQNVKDTSVFKNTSKNKDRAVKQVIVFRKDLLKGDHAIRKGKFAAQVAHGSLGALLKLAWRFRDEKDVNHIDFRYGDDSGLKKWLDGIFTKVCLSIDNDEELINLYNNIKDNSEIPCALITDCGLTEFHGVPTNTCIGIGPWWSDEIDKFTGNLKLL